METLFRFNIMHDANRSRDETYPIDLEANTRFQKDAAAIPTGSSRPGLLKALAKAYIGSNQFIDSPGKDAKLQALENASLAIDKLLVTGVTNRDEVKFELNKALGDDPGDFVNSLLTQADNVDR